MDTPVYVCTGKCGAVISQERFDKGLQSCGADGCDHKGKPFEKKEKCVKCGEVCEEKSGHKCDIKSSE